MIDPTISLGIKPPQFADPLDQQAKALNLLAVRQQIATAPLRQAGEVEQLRASQLENQQRQIQMDQQRAVNKAYQGAFTAGPDGSAQFDSDKMASSLATAGHGAAIPGILEGITKYKQSLANLSESNGKVAEAQRDAAGALGWTVSQANHDPQLFLSLTQHAIDSKSVDGGMVAPIARQVQQALAQDPSGETARALVKQISGQFIAGSPEQQKLINERQTAQARADQAKTGQDRLNAELPGFQADSQIKATKAKALQSMTAADWFNALNSTVSDQASPLYLRTRAAMQLALSRGDLASAQLAIKDAGDQLGRTESAVATAKATAPIKINVAAATAGARADAAGLTDDDYLRAGEQYARTGVMPAIGRDSISRGKIVHAGNQWAQDNGLKPADVVTMQAAYKGDTESLKKFQTSRDQIVSFEATAQKNLDLMLEKAQPLIDAGSPLLNKPLRSIARNALGNTDQAAFDAAMLVARNEVAKVTSGGGLSGVLSDSARHEVEAASSPNATLAQIIAVANVMKRDMANRHAAMDASLADIRGRIGGNPGGQAGGQEQTAPALPSVLSSGDKGKVYTNRSGQRIRVTDVNPANPKQFKFEVVQ